MTESSSRRRRYGRWICKICGYEASDTDDRIKHYSKNHPEVDFDPRFMARFWGYKKGVKPRIAKTLCTLCKPPKEFPVGTRTQHLEACHPNVEPDYNKYFTYPK